MGPVGVVAFGQQKTGVCPNAVHLTVRGEFVEPPAALTLLVPHKPVNALTLDKGDESLLNISSFDDLVG